ncbi:DUF1905 domain-containing protein [Nocardia tengchongensis]|uniref:DUF1905 domain-containing protein n=1 Tax=Nocardia tengchongensis TaxID=2055889 RepID=UPI0036654651
MAKSAYTFTAELWEWEAQAAWHFVSLPEAVTDEIDELYGHTSSGFGSVKVKVTVGASRWSTSIFPARKEGTYILPVKKAVRTAEGLSAGDPVEVELQIV